MSALLPSLGGVALFLAAGLGLSELVPSVRRLPWPRRLGWAYLLGLAGLAGALYALSHFLDVPLRRPAILGVAGGLVVVGIAARGLRRLPTVETPRGASPLGRTASETPHGASLQWGSVKIATALLLLICLGLAADAVTDPVSGWDSRMTWGAQALWVLDEGTVDSEVLRRANLYVSHPEYPLLLPVAQVAVMATFAVPQDVHAFRLLYVACFAAFLLVLWDAGRRWAGRLPALLAGLAAAGVPALTFFEDSGAASEYSDLPLGCFYGAGLLLLLRGRRSFADALGAGLLLAGAALTKNEGALLAFFALGAAALVLLKKRDRPRQIFRLGAAALLVFFSLALLASWRSGIPNRQDERYEDLLASRQIWPDVVTRIPLISNLALRQMLHFERWTLFWIAVPVVLRVGRRGWSGRRKALASALAAGVLAPLAIAWSAYSIHPVPESLVPVTWGRFLIQGSLPLLLLLALALRDALHRSPLGARLARDSRS